MAERSLTLRTDQEAQTLFGKHDQHLRRIEQALGVHFLPGSIYLISKMPSDPQWADITPIALISLVLSLAATLYPSWRASRVQPAEALRYE